jgi:hypothetical protein
MPALRPATEGRRDPPAQGTAPGSVDSLPVRLRPRWKDQHRAQAVPHGVPAGCDHGCPAGRSIGRAGRQELRGL